MSDEQLEALEDEHAWSDQPPDYYGGFRCGARAAAGACAAGPWVKIEPGCEMPGVDAPLLLRQDEYEYGAGWWVGGDSWGGIIFTPTHYAPINPPEEA